LPHDVTWEERDPKDSFNPVYWQQLKTMEPLDKDRAVSLADLDDLIDRVYSEQPKYLVLSYSDLMALRQCDVTIRAFGRKRRARRERGRFRGRLVAVRLPPLTP
jgi:hypothetical protein